MCIRDRGNYVQKEYDILVTKPLKFDDGKPVVTIKDVYKRQPFRQCNRRLHEDTWREEDVF